VPPFTLITVVLRRRALGLEHWSSLTSGSFRSGYSNRCTNSKGLAWIKLTQRNWEALFSLRMSLQVSFLGREELRKMAQNIHKHWSQMVHRKGRGTSLGMIATSTDARVGEHLSASASASTWHSASECYVVSSSGPFAVAPLPGDNPALKQALPTRVCCIHEIHRQIGEAGSSRKRNRSGISGAHNFRAADQEEEAHQSSFENRVILRVILKTERPVAAFRQERGPARQECIHRLVARRTGGLAITRRCCLLDCGW
jgi:hypothetical protein